MFGDIWNKIVGSSDAEAKSADDPTPASDPSVSAGKSEAPTQMSEVDVESNLSALESQKGVQLNWRTSIVDLLKLLDLDSSLSARKQLASELNVHEGADGSAEENIALHKAVMLKLEENGGKVPDSLKGN